MALQMSVLFFVLKKKNNNEAALPTFTESSLHVGTGKYGRLRALFPALWAPLLFPPGWKLLLKGIGFLPKWSVPSFQFMCLTFL